MTISNNNQDVSVDGPKWYIVHTYSGQEDIVERNLKLRIQSLGMHEKIMDVVVPTEEEVVFKDGQRTPERKKLFPGYILVQMTMDDDSWYIVRNTPGVTGFVSSEDGNDRRSKPTPLEDSQVDEIFKQVDSTPSKVKIGFQNGDVVRITEGPFVDFIGAINDVDESKGKVRVLVSFFGRETPVELDFLQVERA
ncbi:MAG: transcription termination/antitermination protein NusG [Dehalococcoidia bacterium]|jgi:transcriptional antiterminator NusG|nr:transcription termination/antitermination protein NusG [Dehalococcoidia bacterium]MQG07678.1 transcription termination/antitermination factor NusG [SAR202 cluster bacterium]CAI8300644.1 MAG: Transcription termination/antitermination protein NusG [Chloroflexota bacterium]MCH2528100.1 transcription termination/antitermination protein NusG [Dehalococcoidia bacterium]MQG26146.1 transcription termination/antitermination factor NusG [SAR202 cluster bacterium]|tara:strand:- start:2595 stop:3173 length:579 start_codon:yes stop_codon:yes gene_type:complete